MYFPTPTFTPPTPFFSPLPFLGDMCRPSMHLVLLTVVSFVGFLCTKRYTSFFLKSCLLEIMIKTKQKKKSVFLSKCWQKCSLSVFLFYTVSQIWIWHWIKTFEGLSTDPMAEHIQPRSCDLTFTFTLAVLIFRFQMPPAGFCGYFLLLL